MGRFGYGWRDVGSQSRESYSLGACHGADSVVKPSQASLEAENDKLAAELETRLNGFRERLKEIDEGGAPATASMEVEVSS